MRLDRFNMNLLVALDAVLMHRTLTEAAAFLRLSQPALSSALRQLREQFDNELISYTPRGPQLTPLAIALQPKVRAVLRTTQDLLKTKNVFDPTTDEAHFRIATTDLVELTFLDSVLPRLGLLGSGLSFDLFPFHHEPVQKTFDSAIDLVIAPQDYASEGVAWRPLYRDTVCVIAGADNYDVGETITTEELFSLPQVAVNHGPILSVTDDDPFADTQRRSNIVVRSRVLASLPAMVARTNLIALLPLRFAKQCALTMPIRLLKLPIPLPEIRLSVAWQVHREDDPALAWLVEELAAEARRFDAEAAEQRPDSA